MIRHCHYNGINSHNRIKSKHTSYGIESFVNEWGWNKKKLMRIDIEELFVSYSTKEDSTLGPDRWIKAVGGVRVCGVRVSQSIKLEKKFNKKKRKMCRKNLYILDVDGRMLVRNELRNCLFLQRYIFYCIFVKYTDMVGFMVDKSILHWIALVSIHILEIHFNKTRMT